MRGMIGRPLSPSSRAQEVFNDFQREVLSEKAATLGRAGKALEAALAKLSVAEAGPDRDALVQAAAEREVCGIHGLGAPLEDFGVPGEVRVRIGASPRPAA